MSARPLVALVYRFGKGCKQYPFETVEALASFASRHPYRNENLIILPVRDRKLLEKRIVPAADAAEYVSTVIAVVPA